MQASEDTGKVEAALSEGGLQIWGDVKFRADAVVEGRIRGNVDGTERVIVSKGAEVTGAVRGSDIRVEGQVLGGVTAAGRVWILPGGKVRVRGSGRSVRIEPGAEFRGELEAG